MNECQEILFSTLDCQDGFLGEITLNRPAALNSLNHDMICAMHETLKKWRDDSKIKAIILKAVEGRAFCAGGDIRLTYERAIRNDPDAMTFFCDEYDLNRCIFHYPKPYISFLNGITMGGGVGISIHGSHRVATEKFLFAMPETGIGFFPDVGGTYFLPRLPHYIGFYLGLTGARIKIDDSRAIGIVNHHVLSSDLPALMKALQSMRWENDSKACVTKVMNQFERQTSESNLLINKGYIESCFSLSTIEEILQALQNLKNPFAEMAEKAILKMSPTSLKVTLRALQTSLNLGFDECMQQELYLSACFLQQHDFKEGIRAVIIDKDLSPQWEPNALKNVSTKKVDDYFKKDN